MNDETVLLFSYGTLQLRAVQLANFGRELVGSPDSLPGYSISPIEITDATVVRLSGKTQHLIIQPSQNCDDEVPGVVFELYPEELMAADSYEPDDYVRISTSLKSGKQAWVYVAIQ